MTIQTIQTTQTTTTTTPTPPKFSKKQVQYLISLASPASNAVNVKDIQSLMPTGSAPGEGLKSRFLSAGYKDTLFGSMDRALTIAKRVRVAINDAGLEFTEEMARKNLYSSAKVPDWLPFALDELGFAVTKHKKAKK